MRYFLFLYLSILNMIVSGNVYKKVYIKILKQNLSTIIQMDTIGDRETKINFILF